MLVISRRPNESVVIGDSILVTLVRLLPTGIELAVRHVTGTATVLSTLGRGQFMDLGQGARVCLVALLEGKARLGIQGPRGLSVHRKEVWDVLRSESR